jgi:hypothetical protein
MKFIWDFSVSRVFSRPPLIEIRELGTAYDSAPGKRRHYVVNLEGNQDVCRRREDNRSWAEQFMESCPCLRLMSILHDIHGNVAHNGLLSLFPRLGPFLAVPCQDR